MSGDELKGLRDLRRARMGDVADIADQLLARQRIAYATLGEPPPPPPKPKRVRRCSPTSKATLQPWKADGVSRRTWYRRLKKKFRKPTHVIFTSGAFWCSFPVNSIPM